MARAKKEFPSTRQGRQLPVLDERLCTGSATCVRMCPTDCLSMDGPLPILARPGHCISCGVCVLVCPANALVMRRVSA
jgi:NAD-dependent dihydropyrimidine dehydrogenase PreA subunit